MSAREAYIAGRSGGSRPRDVSTGSPGSSSQRQQEQNAYDAGQQERQRAQTIKEEGIAGLPQREQKQAKKIAEITKKDPYDTLTEKEKIEAGYPEEKEKKFKFTAFSPTAALIKKWLIDPKPDMFTDPNKLAILKYGILKTPEDYVEYFKKWKDIIDEGMGKDTDFEKFKNAIESASIPQGSEAQRRFDAESYYDKDLYYDKDATGIFGGEYGKKMSEYDLAMQDYPKFLSDMGLKPLSSRFANTIGNLEDIAGLDVNAKNPDGTDKYSRSFKQRIFDARETVSRDRDDRRANRGLPSLDVGIPGILPTPTPDPTPTDPTPDPTDPPGIPSILPTPSPIFAASPFDYSQWAQFGPQYPGYVTYGPAGGPIPNYVNQGLGSAPQFNYWNQIANTFPGMRL